MEHIRERKIDIFRVIVALCAITFVIVGIWKVFGQVDEQPLRKTRRMQIIELIQHANKNADGYRLTEEDEQTILNGYAQYLEYIYLAEEYKGFHKRRLNPKNKEDVLAYVILNESSQRAWAFLADFYTYLLYIEDNPTGEDGNFENKNK